MKRTARTASARELSSRTGRASEHLQIPSRGHVDHFVTAGSLRYLLKRGCCVKCSESDAVLMSAKGSDSQTGRTAVDIETAAHGRMAGAQSVTGTQSVNGGVAKSTTGGVVLRQELMPQMVPASQSGRGHVVVPGIGLRFPRQLPFEAWLGVGRQLSAVVASSAWCLGDWLAFGQQAYGGRYREALEQTGLDYQTLRNYAWVARRFGLSRRRDYLSFGHHAEVAALPEPEQDFWLRKAEEYDWSTSRLRREVRTSLLEREAAQPDPDSAIRSENSDPGDTSLGQRPDRQVMVKVHLTPEQAQLCEHAAGRQSLTVAAWAAQILDQAARGSL